jgi:translocation and assembly module TamB
MRIVVRVVVWVLAVAIGVPLVGAVAVFVALNTDPGRRFAERMVARATDGEVQIGGLGGRFPDALRVARIDLRDEHGTWLALRDVALDWAPGRLAQGVALVERLHAVELDLPRLPRSAQGETPPAESTSGGDLPVPVQIRALAIERIVVGADVAGAKVDLSGGGSGRLDSLAAGRADLTLHAADGGLYHLLGHLGPAGIDLAFDGEEPAGGLLARLAQAPDLGAVRLHAKAAGPWNATESVVELAAGQLSLHGKGHVDLVGDRADLDLTASAPAMAPRPDVAWQRVDLQAHVTGPFDAPQAQGTLEIDGVRAADGAVRHVAAKLAGDQGHLTLEATLDGVRLPGPSPDLLAAAPLKVTAAARLDAPDRPVTFTLAHPLFGLDGSARTEGALSAKAHLTLPDLAPLAALGGVVVRGQAALDLDASEQYGTIAAGVAGDVALTEAPAPAPALLGPAAHLAATARLRGPDVERAEVTVTGAAATLGAQGSVRAGALDLDWRATLADLSLLAPRLRGSAEGHGHVAGRPDDLTLRADLAGDVGTDDLTRGPVAVTLDVHGLPDKPSGRIIASGTLDAAKLALDVQATRGTDGTLSATIDSADWKSAHAEGSVLLPPGATLPQGKVALRVGSFDDLSRLVGQRLAGSLTATAQFDPQAEGRGLAQVSAEARDAGVPGAASVQRAVLAAKVVDPMADAKVEGTLDVAGLRAGGLGGNGKLAANGTLAALALKLQTTLTGLAGSDAQASAAATLDVPGKAVTVSTLQATWNGLAPRLLAPARVRFGDGVAVDRLRVGVGSAEVEAAGRVTPTLALTASLRGVTPDLAHAFVPDLQADGRLEGEAKLGGTLAQPTGTVRLSATGLHMRNGPASSFPPGEATAQATLAGTGAQVDVRASLGRARLGVTGTAPLGPSGPIQLRAQGAVDLALLNPVLSARGRQVRGDLTLDGMLAGTLAAPRASGSARLTGGEVQDFAQGAHLSHIEALIAGQGDTLRLERLSARAGQGTVSATGSLGLAAPKPVSLTLTARNAQVLASDRMTAVIDADLGLHGDVAGAMALSGKVNIDRTDIRVPDRLPASIAVLDVRRPGQAAPPPPAPPPDIGLDVTVTSPGQMFVRGRGLFAELAGRLRVGGTLGNPVVDGGFRLRRGEFNLAGQVLTFTSGTVRFQGDVTDPLLNFVATSERGQVTATLTITGTASAPKFALTSSPPLPQDEILAQLLFGQNASALTAGQLAQMAAALAQISGVGGGALDPLNSIRQELGLDRLSVGGGQNGSGASVELGRYVAPGVYVRVRQAANGSGTQATVQVDLMRGLKGEASVGVGGTTSATGANGSENPYGTSVGLSYQFNY